MIIRWPFKVTWLAGRMVYRKLEMVMSRTTPDWQEESRIKVADSSGVDTLQSSDSIINALRVSLVLYIPHPLESYGQSCYFVVYSENSS